MGRNEEMYARNLITSSAVGMTPFYGGWNRVYKILSKHLNGFVGDYAKLDSSLLGIFIECQADKTWTGLKNNLRKSGASKVEIETHRLRFFKLVNEEINSLMLLPDGTLLQKHLGTPSGSNNTVVINTLAIFQLMAACFIYHNCGTYEVFKSFVAMVLYGDDKTFTVADELIDRFNGPVLQEFVGMFGMTLKINHDPKPPMELEFLSFGFAMIPKLGKCGIIPTRCDKYHAGLAKRDDGKPSTRLARLSSFMQLLFVADKSGHSEAQHLVKLIKKYREELLVKYEPLLGGTADWCTAKSTWMTDQNLFSLHFGSESGESLDSIKRGTPHLKSPDLYLESIENCIRTCFGPTSQSETSARTTATDVGQEPRDNSLRTSGTERGCVTEPNFERNCQRESEDHNNVHQIESQEGQPSKADRFALCLLERGWKERDCEKGEHGCKGARAEDSSVRAG